MMRTCRNRPPRKLGIPASRRGFVLVLTAVLIVVIFAMLAFSVDMASLALTKTQLQIAADAAALGSCQELPAGLGRQPELDQHDLTELARDAAVFVAGQNRNGGMSGTYVDPFQDVRFGQTVWNSPLNRWETEWDVPPFNTVRVQTRRSSKGSEFGDRQIDLAFAPVIGINQTSLQTTATAALLPGVGIYLPVGSSETVHMLPFALDLPSWEALMDGVGQDEFSYDPVTGNVSSGPDGILEVDLYPYGIGSLPPGNRGTVDLGAPNNSTADLKRQILHGLNAYDLSFFGGEIRTDNGPIQLNGDTGISAGMKGELEQIKGRPRLIPLFTHVSGPGNNAMYTVPKFVGIRIMYVQLTGNNKRVIVQPAPFVSKHVIRGGTTIEPDSYFSPPRLIN